MKLLKSVFDFSPARIRQSHQWSVGRVLGLLGVLVIGAVVLITYYPALRAGFWTDDFGFVENAGKLLWADYLTLFFDPRVQISWYRPMQGMQWRFEYILFHGDPTGYHLLQILYHLANCLLLYAIVAQATRKPRVGLIAALIYAPLPIYSVAVMWLAVVDPLASFFFLLTIWLWLRYLDYGGRFRYGLTFLAFVCSLFSKEVTAPLPFVLLLIDLWLVAKPTPAKTVIRRNAPFFLFLPVYALLESTAILQGVFPKNMGYTPGLHSLSILFQYLLQMVFPSETESLVNYVALAILILGLAYATYRRNFRALFLGAIGFLVLLPLLPFHGVISRYLYLPLMLSGAAFGLLCDWILKKLGTIRWAGRLFPGFLSLTIAFLVLGSSMTTAERAENYAGIVRQTNLYFRPLFQRYPSLAPGTLLYVVDLPFVTYNISGLMFLHYGTNVSVASVETRGDSTLRDYNAAFVLYSDSKNVLQVHAVDKNATVSISPTLPARFQESISLDRFELVNTAAKRGEDIVLFLYWRGEKKVDKDYTVFAHLVDADGKTIAGYDSQPARGKMPTSTWELGQQVKDAIVLPIEPDAPVGDDYRLEVGVYDLQTLQRLNVIDAQGQQIADKVVLEPFRISE